MSVLDDLIGILVPHDCVGCGVEGRLLCRACSGRLTPTERICYRCQRPSPLGITCPACPSPLSRVHVVTGYSGPAKALIWQLKLNGAQAAARLMARHMASLLNDSSPGTSLVPVPTATSRARRRGYDQAKLLAKELSRQMHLPYLDCLARQGSTSQHGATRPERFRQLQSSFRTKRQVQAKRIILIDDVITTGATVEAAAYVLKEAGAGQVEAILFARPSK